MRLAAKGMIVVVSAALLATGCGAQTQDAAVGNSASETATAAVGNVTGRDVNISVANETGADVVMWFSLDSDFGGYSDAAPSEYRKVPSCIYPNGEGSTRMDPVVVNKGSTKAAGVLEFREAFLTRCDMSIDTHRMGIEVAQGGNTEVATMQIGNCGSSCIGGWSREQAKNNSVRPNMPSTNDNDSWFQLRSTYDSGTYTIHVTSQEREVVTDPAEAQRILTKYCGTPELMKKNCEMPGQGITVRGTRGKEESYGSVVDNSCGGTKSITQTVGENKTWTQTNGVEVGLEITTKIGIPFIASAEQKVSAKYSHSWETASSFSESKTMEVEPGMMGGWFVTPGFLVAKGDFIVTLPDQGNRRAEIKNFAYQLPLIKTITAEGNEFYPVVAKSRVWKPKEACTSVAPGTRPPADSKVVKTEKIPSLPGQ